MTNTEALEGNRERSPGECRSVVSEDSLWTTVPRDGALQHSDHSDPSRPGHPLERDQAAPVVVDDSNEPDWKHAQHPDERQVHAPQLQPTSDLDSTPRPSPFIGECHDELTSPGEDPPERLARRPVTQYSLREASELPGTQLGLLDMETHHLLLDVPRRAVPRAAAMREVVLNEKSASAKPAPAQPPHRAAKLPHGSLSPALVLVDGDREPQQDADDADAKGGMADEQKPHVRIFVGWRS